MWAREETLVFMRRIPYIKVCEIQRFASVRWEYSFATNRD